MTHGTERERRRDTFLSGAVDYDSCREGYPDVVFQTAVELAHLPAAGSLLEVGCGTGQATRWFAQHGFRVLAVDRSEAMVAVAARQLAGFPHLEVRCSDFERMELRHDFDGLVAASSFHWLDPSDRVGRCAAALRANGALILLWNVHPFPFTGFFERVQSLYEEIVPEWPAPSDATSTEERLRAVLGSLEESGSFATVEYRSHAWSRKLDGRSYVKLLGTHSDHRSLGDEQRDRLFAAVRALIDREFGGEIERPYRTELIVARRGGR